MNGRGTLLTTEQCLLNKNRNPSLGKAADRGPPPRLPRGGEHRLAEEGVAGDDTDGHVDDIARFVDENTVVCMAEADAGDVNHAASSRTGAPLEAQGRPGPQPGGRPNRDAPRGRRGTTGGSPPATPTSTSATPRCSSRSSATRGGTAQPSRRSRNTSTGRKVVPVDCRELVYGFGGIHCVTQQQPAPLASGIPSCA